MRSITEKCDLSGRYSSLKVAQPLLFSLVRLLVAAEPQAGRVEKQHHPDPDQVHYHQ